MPISSRPSASAPGERSSPTPRIATKADAQASSGDDDGEQGAAVEAGADGRGGMFTVGP